MKKTLLRARCSMRNRDAERKERLGIARQEIWEGYVARSAERELRMFFVVLLGFAGLVLGVIDKRSGEPRYVDEA